MTRDQSKDTPQTAELTNDELDNVTGGFSFGIEREVKATPGNQENTSKGARGRGQNGFTATDDLWVMGGQEGEPKPNRKTISR